MAIRQLITEIATLSTARGRVTAFGIATTAIFFSQYHWLDHLSLWGRLGIPSPSIGLTRSYWLLIHGHPVASWHTNPLIYAVLAVGIPLITNDVIHLLRSRRAQQSASDMVQLPL